MKQSAGILLYRQISGQPEFFLVHPGGLFFKNKNEGWWTIPKGEPEAGEELLDTARREFKEETGYAPQGPFTPLGYITQKGGKQVHAWACEHDIDATKITCNNFEMEWPPKSGKMQLFPEIDKAGWFTADKARLLINERQAEFLARLLIILSR